MRWRRGLFDRAPAHRLDEFPAGYSLAGCSPAGPASASPAGSHFEVPPYGRSSIFHRTANSVLTDCLSQGDKRNHAVWFDAAHLKMKIPFGILLPQDYETQTRQYPVL